MVLGICIRRTNVLRIKHGPVAGAFCRETHRVLISHKENGMGERAEGRLVWDAEDYSRSSAMQKRSGRELISRLALRGDERVLDIGCGDGLLASEIAELLPRGSVLGVDSSREMIRFACSTYIKEGFPNLDFEVMDASDLSFEDEFDIVFSNAALHWVSDHLPILRGIKRGLKPGGRAFLQMGGSGSHLDTVNVLAKVLGSKTWRGYFSNFNYSFGFHDPRDYEAWLVEVGLTPLRVELLPRDMAMEGRGGLVAWIRTTWLPFTQKVPEDERERFIGEFADEYLELYPPDEEGIVHAQSTRLVVEAEKTAAV
jgi:trans-aconitate methyltransferase